jgi:hypothetical protein
VTQHALEVQALGRQHVELGEVANAAVQVLVALLVDDQGLDQLQALGQRLEGLLRLRRIQLEAVQDDQLLLGGAQAERGPEGGR